MLYYLAMGWLSYCTTFLSSESCKTLQGCRLTSTWHICVMYSWLLVQTSSNPIVWPKPEGKHNSTHGQGNPWATLCFQGSIWMLGIMLLWTWVYKYLFEALLSILLALYPEVKLLDHIYIYIYIYRYRSISISNSLRNHHIVFCSSRTILYFHQQCTSNTSSNFFTSLSIHIIFCFFFHRNHPDSYF